MDILIPIIFVSILYLFVELVLLNLFILPFFKIGIPIGKKITIDLEELRFPKDEKDVLYMDFGKFKFTDKNEVFMLPQFEPDSYRFRFKSPFLIIAKGKLIEKNQVEIIAKQSFGSVLVFLSFLVAFTTGSIACSLSIIESILICAIVWLFIGLIFLINYLVGKERVNTMRNELMDLIKLYNE
jgi:hypothetical protein